MQKKLGAAVRRGSRPRKPVGFIGQGFIGKSYADDFERRGIPVVRYAADAPYAANKDALKSCGIVFIAVPTPTTPRGFDGSIVRSVISLTAPGATVVIKSTLFPGMTEDLQRKFKDRVILHSPEFLSESTAAYDAAHPKRNIIGVADGRRLSKLRAREVMKLLPKAPFSLICGAAEAELIKYARNIIGYARVILANMLFDLASVRGASWEVIRAAVAADPDNGPTYMSPVHKSGRGAGGRCFIKDMAAFGRAYRRMMPRDHLGAMLIKALEEKNAALLTVSGKDIELLRGVYGDEIADRDPEGR